MWDSHSDAATAVNGAVTGVTGPTGAIGAAGDVSAQYSYGVTILAVIAVPAG